MANPTYRMPMATILGLSGCSSSGKTTLARLLRLIFPYTIILHQDDFYLSEESLPFRTGFRDWDCAASLDISSLVQCLRYMHKYGNTPPEFISKEDQNSVGPNTVDPKFIEEAKLQVAAWLEDGEGQGRLGPEKQLVILDGFLLFGESVRQVRDVLDVKVFLRAKYESAKDRRENRTGYVTLEGFWEDPPGYFDRVVWPNYVEQHGFLFQKGDVEGDVEEATTRKIGIHVCPGNGEWGMQQMLSWAIDSIKEALAVG